jgi:hypothetical protein
MTDLPLEVTMHELFFKKKERETNSWYFHQSKWVSCGLREKNIQIADILWLCSVCTAANLQNYNRPSDGRVLHGP